MPTARRKTSTKRIKNLPAKRIASKQAKSVRGGYIGETEKLKGAAKKGAI